ncbi:uncharacterized protein FIBRA_08003 [Fibroporia radiculosa]|uniref:Heterokaryon incompatibility domain-containing protein n=1 Tax=Fibroporia radiculosa TaxID=599839 RepID=J4GW04_9APHY|nr:uncharacterized protein FIBRA_08003 [Fibroporia radiculosa]CCM05770.1 predicted protein [Fibroporia radiculosa]
MTIPDLFDAFIEFVFNDMPARLIYIPEMRFVAYDEVISLYTPKIADITEKDIQDQTGSRNRFDISRKEALAIVVKGAVKYAMFSHRWLSAGLEPTFQDLASPDSDWQGRTGAGYDKLRKFLEKAQVFGCMLAWSDTCCINKTSSAELEEAIRSMFRWYRNSHMCIAYLSQSSSPADFADEVWFSRGWTLQELLAPPAMKFYGRNWEPLTGDEDLEWHDKRRDSFLNEITKVTSIPYRDLFNYHPGTDRVHEKMLWASHRRTTKTEDMAYALIGIFDITMPIAYGEGAWAFVRLVEAIMGRCGEWGIFAWVGQSSRYSTGIAESPGSYRPLPFTGNYREGHYGHVRRGDKLFKPTKRGVKLRLLLVAPTSKWSDGSWSEVNNHRYKSFTFNFDSGDEPDDGVLEEVMTKVDASEVSSEFKVAVGVLNYFTVATDESQGILLPGNDFVGLLLHADPGEPGSWKRISTDELLLISCRKVTQRRLTTVWL